MSRRKQEVVNSDLAGKKSLALPLAAARRGNLQLADEIEVSRHADRCCRNRGAHFMEGLEKVKASSRRAQLTALSKVVNKAFTGWTIKTQR